MWWCDGMDPFRRCVQDLEAINRLLDLPNGYDIALVIFREMLPHLWQLDTLKDRDPSGAVACLFDYAESIRIRLDHSRFKSCAPPSAEPPSAGLSARVA